MLIPDVSDSKEYYVIMSNGELWDSLVSAEREVAKLRAALNNSNSTTATLANALSADSGVGDKYAAMNFLRAFPRYVPEFTPQLFRYSLGERWQGLARNLIAAGPRQEVMPEVIRLTFAKLPGSDADDYLHLAALLTALEAGEELGEIAVDAFGSESEDIREAGAFILEHYRTAIPPKFWR